MFGKKQEFPWTTIEIGCTCGKRIMIRTNRSIRKTGCWNCDCSFTTTQDEKGGIVVTLHTPNAPDQRIDFVLIGQDMSDGKEIR